MVTNIDTSHTNVQKINLKRFETWNPFHSLKWLFNCLKKEFRKTERSLTKSKDHIYSLLQIFFNHIQLYEDEKQKTAIRTG